MSKVPQKIMYLIDDYRTPYAGTEGQLLTLITELDRSKYDPEITLFRESEYIKEHGFPCKVNVLNITRLKSFHALRKMIAFSRSLARNNCRLVHIYFNDPSLIAPVILKLSGCNVIISRRDMGYWYTPLSVFILRLNRFFVDAVITNSEAVKKITHENERIPLSKIQVIYNGNSANVSTSSTPGNDESTFDIGASSRLIGLVANIRPIKKIDDLIRAFSLVSREFTDAELVIVGSGDSKELEELAGDFKLSEKVHFLGGQSNARLFIKKFDVAVSCSESEGFSNSIIEYMQCMVPVVCNDVGGNGEIVINNETGFLVPKDNIEELADKICQVLREPDQAKNMAIKASDYVSELCDKNKMVDKHSKVYDAM